MKYLFYAATVMAIVYGCSVSGGKRSANGQNFRVPLTTAISENDIYNWEKVRTAITTLDEEKYAEYLFLKAMDIYKNQKDAPKSIDTFIKSITYKPTAKAYYELSCAYIDANNPESADNANTMAISLGYEPGVFTAYNYAITYLMKKDTSRGIELLGEALNQGYADKEHFMNDKNLEIIKNTQSYQAMVAKYFSPNNSGAKALFNLFVKGFPKGAMPFSILKDPALAYDDKKMISYDFVDVVPDMQDSRYSRDVSNEYSYTARLMKKDSFDILAYTTKESVSDTLPPVTTYLASYDTSGKNVDHIEFACQCTPVTFKTGEIDTSGLVTVKLYMCKLKYPDQGYEGNSIVSTELYNTTYYQFDKTGHFKKTDAPVVSGAQASGGKQD